MSGVAAPGPALQEALCMRRVKGEAPQNCAALGPAKSSSAPGGGSPWAILNHLGMAGEVVGAGEQVGQKGETQP